jgi:hypothetical protein
VNPVQTILPRAFDVDAELRDAGVCGPELAHLGAIYCDSPRALVFRAPSPDWRLMMLILPLASRLSLLSNPIFASLARNWGLGVRFVGIDRDGLAYDFRALLGDRTLRLLIELLAECERGTLRNEAPWLDVLFDALAAEMLTCLERRRDDWARHLDREHRLEPGGASSLFAHEDRYPDFIGRLRQALREHTIDSRFYGRVLRSIDARESEVDQRMQTIILGQLNGETLGLLHASAAGLNLGCYNWLQVAPRHRHARAHLLGRLPWMAHFLAETLIPVDTGRATDPRDALVRQAIDGGQDRFMIEALAARLAVSPALMRRLWREPPKTIGVPAAWLLPTLMHCLDSLEPKDWPHNEDSWHALIEAASEAALASQ